MAKTLASILREARARAGLTQAELAKSARMDPGHLSRIETGLKGTPNFETVARLADALGLSLDALAADCGFFPRGRSARAGANASAVAARVRRAQGGLGKIAADLAEAATQLERGPGRTR